MYAGVPFIVIVCICISGVDVALLSTPDTLSVLSTFISDRMVILWSMGFGFIGLYPGLCSDMLITSFGSLGLMLPTFSKICAFVFPFTHVGYSGDFGSESLVLGALKI